MNSSSNLYILLHFFVFLLNSMTLNFMFGFQVPFFMTSPFTSMEVCCFHLAASQN